MPELSKSDEAKLLMRVLECSTQSQGWYRILELIETQLNCRSFLAEFDPNGNPTPHFGGHGQARQLGTVLQKIELESGRSALQFLLSEASLYYPYCKTSLHQRSSASNGAAAPHREPVLFQAGRPTASSGDAESDHLDLLISAPGLVSPLWRTEKSTILFACLFTAHRPETIDQTIACETFETIVRALAPGLNTYFELEKERAYIQIHRTLLSALENPAILINAEKDILVHTPTALEALEDLGLAAAHNQKLVFRNKQIETGLQVLLSDPQAHDDTGTAKVQSVYLPTRSGSLKRVSLETVTPPMSKIGTAAAPFFLIRVTETAELSEDVEHILQEHFDLSQSEAHLARHLTMTGSMNVTADQLGITRNTAKTHLRRIYEKTGVHTQLQLARLVHKLAGLF